MRITNNMLVNNMMNNIGNNLVRMDKYQNQLSTGKKIAVPSDDPVVAARALKLRTDVAEVDQYKRNSKDAQSWMDITESTLANIGDVLQRARELTVQGANGSNTTQDTQKIAEEVKQLRAQLIHLGNTTYAGRYIFSGYKTNTKLIDEATGEYYIDVNNSENIKYEIGIGDDININVPGGDLFSNGGNAAGQTSGVTTGSNVVLAFPVDLSGTTLNVKVDTDTSRTITFPAGSIYNDANALAAGIQSAINGATPSGIEDITVNAVKTGTNYKFVFTSGTKGATAGLSAVAISGGTAAAALGLAAPTQVNGTAGQTGKLIQDMDSVMTALSAGDNLAASNLIATLDTDVNNVLRIRADVGARQNRIDLTSNRLDSDSINFTKLMSDNEDVDMAETIMNLQNEENVYRASLSGGARVIQPNLVDFLR